MTPDKVMAARTPKEAAERFAAYLKAEMSATNVFVWSPEETKSRGWGSGWAVCWEEGPFEWAIAVSGGSSLYAGETGQWSAPGAFPSGLSADKWNAEPYNGFILNFYAD